MELLTKSSFMLICCVAISASETLDSNDKFSPCKGTRTLNSLEAMKAQGLATRIGAKCMSSKIVQFISKHQVPTFAFVPLADKMCQGTLVGYSYFAEKDIILSKKTTADDLLGVYKLIFHSALNQNWTVREGKGGREYQLPIAEFVEIGMERLECVLKVEKAPVRDANLILFSINHLLRILAKS